MQPAGSDTHRPLVALVCSNAYPLFDASVKAVIGGMETRAALFGRALAATGRWRVNFVVSDFGQPFITHHEGIDFQIYQPAYRRVGRNVFPRLRKRRWFPAISLRKHDLNLLWQIPMIVAWLAIPALFFPRFWRSMKPDVVCCFGNNSLSAEVIADCRRLGIPTVLCLAADTDLSHQYRPEDRTTNDYGMARWKGHYSLLTADRIVVQSENQHRALLWHFGRSGVLIRNPVHVTPNDPVRWPPRDKRDVILWIGRADTFHKRPLLCLELAKRCPDLPFLMIVNMTHADVSETLKVQRPPNVTIIEYVSPQEIGAYYRRARVFVSTSAYEGFPNTFLQCAVMGVPIVSFEVDPDAMLSRNACGICASGDAGTMRRAVQQLWSDPGTAEALALACHNYALTHHRMAARVAELEACLHEVSAGPCVRPLPWPTLAQRFSGRGTHRQDSATSHHGRERA